MASATVPLSELNDNYVGLAIATLVIMILAGICLQYTRRFRRMPAYFLAHFSFFKGKSPALPIIATVLYYILLATPLILLVVWSGVLGGRHGANPALPVFFTGLFIILLFLPSQSRFFYYKSLALLLTFCIAQFLIVGQNWEQGNYVSFFALTAIMLTLNAIFVATCLWLIDGSSWNIQTNTPADLKTRIMKEVKIWKKEDEPPEIINGGVYGFLTSMKLIFKGIFVAVSYLISLGILLIYSIIGKVYSGFEYQATVNSCAVITTDLITLMLILVTKKEGVNPIFNAFVAVAVRVCIVAFSGQYWFAGYCLLYLILFVYISGLLINKYYPSYEQFPPNKPIKTNIFKMPELPLIVLVVMFSGLVYYMGVDEGKTLPISTITLGDKSYPFWALGVACVLLSFSIFFYMISLRIIQRSRDRVRSMHIYYLGCESCGQYYFFLLISYAFLIILGLYFYFKTGTGIVWASCVFLPLFYQAFVAFYANWKENDYLLLGDIKEYNKKILKREKRRQKIQQMQTSAIGKLKEEGREDHLEEINANTMNLLANAEVERNFMVDDVENETEFSERRADMGIVQAFRENKLLPTDRKIIIALPVMAICLVGYSIAFFFSSGRDLTAFTVSVEILFIFLCFIPTKRYFATFETPQIGQIISFVVGILINYGFGVASYAAGWNRSPAYTVLWCIINIFAIACYASYCLVRDKGIEQNGKLFLPTLIACGVSILLSFGVGVILIAWFDLIGVGIALLGAAFFYTYFLVVYLIYLKMNKSVPFVIYPVTMVLVIGACFAVMIYGFVDKNFDDFYGFTVTYLVINVLLLIYASYRILSDIRTRFDQPNFYSAYGSPIYKYNPNIKSAALNMRPMYLWLAAWFMFYIYTTLMAIFIRDPNYSVAAAQIFLIVTFLTFIYFTTYNLYRAAKIQKDITPEILDKSWNEVLEAREKSVGNFLDLNELEQQMEQLERQKAAGKHETSSLVQIVPRGKSPENDLSENKMNQAESKATPAATKDINVAMFELETKIDKARENDKILLVNFWVNIIFRCENVRKKNMLQFTNFIRDSGDILADGGIAIILDSALYDLESVYNQAFQEYQTLSPVQKIYFQKQLALYTERKKTEEQERERMSEKENENQLKRQQQLEKKLLDSDDKQDDDLPIEKMRDSPLKFQKINETVTCYTDSDFRANNDVIPPDVRGDVKGWKRPTKGSVVFKDQETGMSVRQGMIGDCYLISAIGVLGKQRIKQCIAPIQQSPNGAYMVKFNKMNKDVYVIIDDQFPVVDASSENEWLFGRCEDKKELFCNIMEKAYAKLYGGYNNIVGGKVALALADMTGGFPEEIELKPYQQSNTNEIFNKMLEFKKAGYLMGAGSPPNAQGDSVEIDGIYQGHAYLVIDVRDLDGNKLIKLRNPHGNDSKESELDWSDDSPKWTKRLKGLINEEMGADGAFWMGLDDFVYCYRALYVCRIFNDSWKKVGPYTGKWQGESAAGLKNPKGRAQLENNPHFGIKVSKACTLFVEVTQNQIEQGRAKNKIFFMVQRNGGKRIEAPATNKMAGMSGPAINSKTISKEINLTADSFPYTFSLMTAIYETGVEGSFSLSMYCNDTSIEVIDDERFDR